MRPGRPNYGSSPVPLHKVQYATRAPKTPNKQRNWPESKPELISKYRKLFSAFIESVDFELIQHSDAN